jgi:hypothetical protein
MPLNIIAMLLSSLPVPEYGIIKKFGKGKLEGEIN